MVKMEEELRRLNNYALYHIIKPMLKQKRTPEEIILNPYLAKHYTTEQIADFLEKIYQKEKYLKKRHKNVFKYCYSLRMNDYLFKLLNKQGNNPAELIRQAIVQVYGTKKSKNTKVIE